MSKGIISRVAMKVYMELRNNLNIEYDTYKFSTKDDKIIFEVNSTGGKNIYAEFDIPKDKIRVHQHIDDILHIANNSDTIDELNKLKDYFDMSDDKE